MDTVNIDAFCRACGDDFGKGKVGCYYQDRSNPFRTQVCNKCGVFFAAETNALRVNGNRKYSPRYERCLNLGMLPERVGIRKHPPKQPPNQDNGDESSLVMLATVASRALRMMSKTVYPQCDHASQEHACGHHSYDEGANDVFL